jgi:hypothetical protein
MGAPSQFQITYVESALIALLKSVMPTAYGGVDTPAQISIDAIGDKDFNAEGQLVLDPVSMRVRFGGMEYNNLRDNQRLSYEAGLTFEVMCYVGSLKGKASERLRTLGLVQIALNQLAGARLALQDGTFTMPITLRAVSPVITEDGPVDQLFSITVLINGIAQFNGPNGGTV